MPIDSDVQLVLDRLNAGGIPPLNTMPPAMARQTFEMTAPILDAKNVPIGAVENRRIPGPAGEIPIRIYTPVTAPAGPLGVLIYFHGGGFVIGSLNTHDAPCRLVANGAGVKVISVDYRLAPEHKFPAAVEDCQAATAWVSDNAAELGIDPDRIAVGGDSAGGNLAAVVSQWARSAGGRPAIRFQLLIYPVTDAVNTTPSRETCGKGYFLETELMTWFFAQYFAPGTNPRDPRLSPLLVDDLSGLPPAYVLTAEFDPLRDEGAAYADKLRAAGVPVTYVLGEGMIHGFWNMSGLVKAAGAAIAAASEALRAALETAPASV